MAVRERDLELEERFRAACRQARLELGIKPRVLAREIGACPSSISRFEAGQQFLNATWALRLVDYLGIDVSEVVGG